MEKSENYLPEWENLWKQHQRFLISFAFRMTGSLSEAEDLAQDTFIECAGTPPSEIRNPKSWLTKICANKSIDHLKSAYKNREVYPGTWLPDVIPDNLQTWDSIHGSDSPEKQLLASESLTISFLLLIERLPPEERAVYLLNEVFEYSFAEIATFLERSEEACRKTAQRARAAVKVAPAFSANGPDSLKLVAEFFEAARNGDGSTLAQLLSDNSEYWSDGGGKVSATKTVLTEKYNIAAFFAMLGTSQAFAPGEYTLDFKQVSSRPGVVITRNLPSGLWAFETILSCEIADNKIARIYAQRNPDKLETLLRY